MPNKPGTAPNTSLVLTDSELDFINRHYSGSKSAAIHKALETLMTTYDYSVIEDNGGGLHLYIFPHGSDVPVKAFGGYEYNPGHLTTDLDLLDKGDGAATWDNGTDDPAADWDDLTSRDYGYQVIAYGEGGQRTLYPERMGRAGQIEFGIDAE